jgi:integrase
VLSWSLDRGLIDANPCEKSGRLYHGERSDAVWTIDDELAYFRSAPQHLHLPLLLGLWTGQREGDLLKLRWSQYDGTHLRLKQGKTGKRVTIPLGKPVRAALDALKTARKPQPFDVILLTTRNRSWTRDGFSSSFRKATASCGIDGLTFRDSRGTAVTRLALAGASVPQIATFTGHSLKDVESILEVHYLNRDPRLAEDALLKLETRAAQQGGREPETGT